MLTYPLPCVCPSHSGHSSAWSRVSCAIQHVLISCTCFIHLLFVVQLLSRVWLSATPWTEAHQASLSFTVSRSLFKPTSIESVMPSNLLILCRPLLLLPSVLPSIRVSSSESAFHIRWPKYWSFSITPSNGVRSTLKKEKKSFSVFSGWEYSPSREPYELGRFGCNSLTCTDQHLFSVFWLELKPRPPGLCSGVFFIVTVTGECRRCSMPRPREVSALCTCHVSFSSQTLSPPDTNRVPPPLGNAALEVDMEFGGRWCVI